MEVNKEEQEILMIINLVAMHAILLFKMAIHIWRLLHLFDYVEIKIFFKCHKTTLFLVFVFYYIKLKKEKVYERTKRMYRKRYLKI